MIVKISTQVVYALADAGVEFTMIRKGYYLISSSTTIGQLRKAGLKIKWVRNDN